MIFGIIWMGDENMKKIIVILLAVLLLAGCTQRQPENKTQKFAVSAAISFLNNDIGYDANKQYLLKGPYTADEQEFPQVYEVYEDGSFLLQVYMQYSDDIMYGGWNAPYGDGYISYAVFPEHFQDISSWKLTGNSVVINDQLFLENVSGVRIEEGEGFLNDDLYSVIRQNLDNLPEVAQFFEDLPQLKSGDRLTVSSYLHEYTVTYDRETGNIAIAPRKDYVQFIVLLNGQPFGLMGIAVPEMQDGGFNPLYQQGVENKMIPLIQDGTPFIVVFGDIVITEKDVFHGYGTSRFVPVIIQKCLPELQSMVPQAMKMDTEFISIIE